MQGYIILHILVLYLAVIGLAGSLPVLGPASESTNLATAAETSSPSDDVVEAYNQILDIMEKQFPELSSHNTNNSKSSKSEDSFEREIRRFGRHGRRKRETLNDDKLNEILAKLTAEERKRELSHHGFGPSQGENVKRGESLADAGHLDSNIVRDPTPRGSTRQRSDDTMAQLIKQITILTDKLNKFSNFVKADESTNTAASISIPITSSTRGSSSEGMDNSEELDNEVSDNSQGLGQDSALEELSLQLLKDHSESFTTPPEVEGSQYSSQRDLTNLAQLFYNSIQVNKVAYQRLSSQIQTLQSQIIK